MTKYIFALFLVFSILIGCNFDDIVFLEFAEFDNEIWAKTDSVKFEVEVHNSEEYIINMAVRNTIDYPVTNLWCLIYAQDSTNRVIFNDTLNITLASNDKHWRGIGYINKTTMQNIANKVVSLPSGKLVFTITHGMQNKRVKGIQSIGLEIKEISKNN